VDLRVRGDPVPPEDHIARYCKPTLILWDGETLIGIDKDAFKPRPSVDDDGISANWLERFGHNEVAVNIQALIERLKSIGFSVRKSGRFAVAQPNAILEAGNAENASLAVIEAPLPQDDTHVLITGIDPEADLVQEALARIVTAYPASVP
jgi:hypothetical protein